MDDLVKQLLSKMGMQNEPQLLDKTKELVRILDLRSSHIPSAVNEYGKIILCADLASTYLGIAFDRDLATKISGLRQTSYNNNKRLFEKLLGLNKLLGINDICVKLGLNEMSKKAMELFELYKNIATNSNKEVDLSHPQYSAMAVFQACKISQKRISKQKIMYYSNLRPSQWCQLELRWDKLIANHYNSSMNKNLKVEGSKEMTEKQKSKEYSVEQKTDEIEDYEIWKCRMLLMAKAALSCEQQIQADNQDTMDCENEFVLGS